MKRDYITWDEYFMGVACLSAMRSKDPNTQVGACIVNADKRIIGIGYNGMPNGCEDTEYPWTNDEENDWLDNKYPYVVHAEANAILNSTQNLKGATIYVKMFPCNECAKLIIQSGIKEVVYVSDYENNLKVTEPSKKMFKSSGVTCRKMEIDLNITFNKS